MYTHRGLSKMNLVWFAIPEIVSTAIKSAVVRLSTSLNSVDTAVLLYSLGTLETPLDTMCNTEFVGYLYASVITHLPKMRSSELAKVLWGLSSGGLRWDDLPSNLHW